MGLFKTAAETYDVYAHLAGKVNNDEAVLLPISHSTFNAQIEVTIDLIGNFQYSGKVEKGKNSVTIIPVTQDSAAKSNGVTPHPLCDKLCYIAGDYTKYTGDQKEKYYDAYIEQLREWADSENTHPMVQAIYNYLAKGTLIQDLIQDHTLILDESGKLTDKTKLQGIGQTEANVRFLVVGDKDSNDTEVWKSQNLYQKYIQYYNKKLGAFQLCYVSGQMAPCSDKHPAKIRNSGDMAKLISGNDKDGFTYRGRFVSKEQAVLISYEVSQKAHNVLRWLLQKQGYTRDESAIVCWMVNRDFPLPAVMEDSVNAYCKIGHIDFDDFFLNDEEDIELASDTGKDFADRFKNAVNGYAAKIKAEDRVAIAAFNASNGAKGRLATVYYDEMGAKQYIHAIQNWQEHCRWRRSIKIGKDGNEQKRITIESTPSPREIALAAYGVQKSKQKSKWLEADKKLLNNTVERLLPCITREGMKIPEDIIRASVRRASMPQTMDERIWYNDVLCVACALIRYKYERGGYTMDTFLEDNQSDRDVLFGRMLAIYDYLEKRAMFERGEDGKIKEGRPTNAKRYWNAYSKHPKKTLITLKENSIPYERKLSGVEIRKFEEWSEEIMKNLANIGYKEPNSDRSLSEKYLPGYYKQMEKMKEEMSLLFPKKKEH